MLEVGSLDVNGTVRSVPTPSVEAYREAGRRMTDWWTMAAPLFDRLD